MDITLSNGFGSFNIDTPSSGIILKTITVVTPIAFAALLLFLGKAFMTDKRIHGSISFTSVIEALGSITLLFFNIQ